MSLDASNDVFKAVRAALLADAWMTSKVGQRVFSSWDNQGEPIPVIRLSVPNTRVYEIDGGGQGSEHDLGVHIFTTESAPIVARQMADRARSVIGAIVALDTADVVAIDYRDTIMRRDDVSPLLQMAVVRFSVVTTTK